MALMPVAEALAHVLAGVTTLDSETVDLRQASGRTLAHAIAAHITQPPFDASAMDGYAVRAEDCTTIPCTLTVIGQAAAGAAFGGELKSGQAVRIFTGAPVPRGADAIVIQEDTHTPDRTHVTILEAAQRGQNIRPRGQDFKSGQDLLKAAQQLGPRSILLAAAGGHASLPLVRRPIVAILATGDELVEPGQVLKDGEIYTSNSYGIAALVEAAGGTAKILGVAKDNLQSLASKIREAQDADILVTTGGASVGDHDLVRPALETAGAKLDFYKIAMRPGKPTFFGSRPISAHTQRILGLPGNPVASLIGARVFLVPLIAKLLGRTESATRLTAHLAQPLAANGPRQHFMRAALDETVSPPRVTPFPSQDSSLVSTLSRANCLIDLPISAPAMPEGASVQILRLDF
ncbi:MAG: molybdopterin molybdenumtransferase MoeA [Hyphomicrobium sp.]|nr:MAG: molybdopterin molybdenumtransferase MoeA [Hyphomicrobium sp.]PPD01857.1 MAG: molybdopterin molybdenumtransferase MoeA [Hyphomicrobium sp.]